MPTEAAPNASERYLANLCRQSFLRFWSWPNVYRDQSWSGGTEGKEICDLLVVFDSHVLIFSDKYCAFPDTGDLSVDWSRWYKNAILKSAKQAWGAERWLTQHPDRLFVDKACTERFPFPLPSADEMKVHRIVVAHGAGARCRQELGGSGSLMIATDIVGDKHFTPEAEKLTPFAVGRIDPRRGFVHVVDDVTLDVVLRTVDTAPDFIEYLQCKEQLIESGKQLWAAGEEELLAYYLASARPDGTHDLGLESDESWISIDQGLWASFARHPDRIAQLKADKVSYAWDTLIDRFTKHILERTQQYTSGHSLAQSELALRLMAKESRTGRRALANSLFTVAKRADKEVRSARVGAPDKEGETSYVFLALKHPKDKSDEDYRTIRRRLLHAYCLVARLKFKGAKHIIGIGTEPWTSDGRSEDLAYLDGDSWDAQQEAEARRLQKEFGLLENVRQFATTVHDFPRLHDEKMRKGRNRNQRCSCGSGKKYKKCCGQQVTPSSFGPTAQMLSET